MSEPPTMLAAAARYRMLVEDNDQAPSLTLLGLPTGEREPLYLDKMADNPVDALWGVSKAFDELNGALLPRPVWIVFCAEAFFSQAARGTRLEPRELEDRHRIGMAGVEEALTGHMRHADGRGWDFHQPFERLPALGTVRWGEFWSTDAPSDRKRMDGRIPW